MDILDHVPLAPRDLVVLSVLAHGPSHGYGIIKEVEVRSDSGVLLDPANLYRTLKRMRELGWIEDLEGPDPRRRLYSITAQGREILTAEVERLEGLVARTRAALVRGSGG